MTVREAFEQLNLDYNELLSRFFEDEQLVTRFLKKFPADKSFEQLCKAKEAQDYKQMEVAAHTLKGIAGNLGLQSLFEPAQALVTAIRNGQQEKAPELLEKIETTYYTIIDVLNQL